MIPQKIGRYEIKAELGRGGMATVYKAYDPRFEREIAIKVLPRELMHDPQFSVRFEREGKTIAALEHSAIVPVYDVGDEDGQPYFVMRLMPGGSLADTIAKGPISLEETAQMLARLAPALDEAHKKNIVHRDLKPGNILFDRSGTPYISDFGIAKITQGQNATVTGGAIIGTPAYMSPEQAQGEQIDGRSDIYALGVIIYEMLSGVQPYQATTPMAVVVKQITDPIPNILEKKPDLPPAIDAIIRKAMAKNPDDRFYSAGELSVALTAVSGGQTAEEAMKTAVIAATKVGAAKTILAPGKTIMAPLPVRPVTTPPPPSTNKFVLPVAVIAIGGVLGLGVLAVILMVFFNMCPPGIPFCSGSSNPANQPPMATLSLSVTDTPAAVVPLLPTDTLVPILENTPTQAATPTQGTNPTPAFTETPSGAPAAAVGGADQVAFIANNEVWLMNLDGSNLKSLTNDHKPKNHLQWVPKSNLLVYISGTNVYSVDAITTRVDTIVTFPFAAYLEEFRISPDAKWVAISLNREMYVVSFDLQKLAAAKGKDGLNAMTSCIKYTGNTLAAIRMEVFRWSQDNNTAAWIFAGNDSGKLSDMIRLTDISRCDPTKMTTIDEFPGTRFTPEGYGNNPKLSDFDWDGKYNFMLTTDPQNNGWGFFYTYTKELHKGNEINPLNNKSRCCYRDARWSPDQTYVFFGFINKDVPGSPEQLYYIPLDALNGGSTLTPILLPDGFFTDTKEPIQPAFHVAQ